VTWRKWIQLATAFLATFAAVKGLHYLHDGTADWTRRYQSALWALVAVVNFLSVYDGVSKKRPTD